MELKVSGRSNADEIRQMFTSVFSDSEGAQEGELIGKLAYELITHTAGQDLHVFIAVEEDVMTGCIIFSRMNFASKVNAFILAPVAIHTQHQGRGVGQKLINFGIDHLKKAGVELIITYGDPGFYSKVGFKPLSVETIHPPFTLSQPEGWLAQSLVADSVEPIPGTSTCVEALNKLEYW